LKIQQPLVISTPDIQVFDIQRDDCFLVLACDGIWDVLSDQEVVDIAGVISASASTWPPVPASVQSDAHHHQPLVHDHERLDSLQLASGVCTLDCASDFAQT
jgi:serine/threonine protein phosphatase PrpC